MNQLAEHYRHVTIVAGFYCIVPSSGLCTVGYLLLMDCEACERFPGQCGLV